MMANANFITQFEYRLNNLTNEDEYELRALRATADKYTTELDPVAVANLDSAINNDADALTSSSTVDELSAVGQAAAEISNGGGAGGYALPVNANLFINSADSLYVAPDGTEWLQSGFIESENLDNYPDATKGIIVNEIPKTVVSSYVGATFSGIIFNGEDYNISDPKGSGSETIGINVFNSEFQLTSTVGTGATYAMIDLALSNIGNIFALRNDFYLYHITKAFEFALPSHYGQPFNLGTPLSITVKDDILYVAYSSNNGLRKYTYDGSIVDQGFHSIVNDEFYDGANGFSWVHYDERIGYFIMLNANGNNLALFDTDFNLIRYLYKGFPNAPRMISDGQGGYFGFQGEDVATYEQPVYMGLTTSEVDGAGSPKYTRIK